MFYNENVGEATHSLLRTPSMRVALRDVQNTKPLLSSGAKRIVQNLTPAGKNPEPNISSAKAEKGSYMKPTEAYKYVTLPFHFSLAYLTRFLQIEMRWMKPTLLLLVL